MFSPELPAEQSILPLTANNEKLLAVQMYSQSFLESYR